MLDPDPVLDDSMFRAAWGWKPNQDRLTTNAYRIAKVVVFTRCHAPLISHQGLPWRLQKSHESAHFESLLAEAENLQEKTRQPSLSKKTRRPNNTGAARDQLRQEKKRKQEVRRAYVLQFEGDMCCGKKCAQLWRTEPENASGCGLVHAVRTAYQALSRDRQREFIYNRMEETLCDGHVKKRLFLESLSDMKTLLVKTHLRLKPLSFSSCQRVCIKFFLWVTGASRNKLYQPTNFSKGLPFSMDLPGRRQHSDPHASLKSTKVIKWLTNFASFHLHDPASKSIFVPFASRRAVYDLYVEESKDPEYRNFYTLDTDNQPNVPSLSYFLRVWKKSPQLHHIRLHKYLHFALCDTCVQQIDARRNRPSKQQMEDIIAKEQDHFNFVRRERQSYYARRDLSRRHPDEFLSIILDGADQAAYGLPHFPIKSETIAHAYKIPLKVMGAIVHGRTPYACTYFNNVKHGTNICIESLHHILSDVHRKEGTLPRVCYIQVDNTQKQNKNRFIIGYAGCLVQWGLFDEVVLSFLPVGHTHEDIDQMFSCLARALRKTKCLDREAILQCFKNAYHSKEGNKGEGFHLTTAANISAWLENWLNDFDQRDRTRNHEARFGVANFHQFRITRQGDEAVLQVKQWCASDENWQGLDEGSEFHKVHTPLLLSLVFVFGLSLLQCVFADLS